MGTLIGVVGTGRILTSSTGQQGIPGSGGPSQYARVLVNAANSPFTAQPSTHHIMDVTGGSVVINLPTGMGAGQQAEFKVKVGTTPSAGSKITINAPGGGNVEQLVPNNGTYGSSIILANAQDAGVCLLYESDGSNNYELH